MTSRVRTHGEENIQKNVKFRIICVIFCTWERNFNTILKAVQKSPVHIFVMNEHRIISIDLI